MKTKNQKWAKWGENSSPLFYPSHPSFLSLFWIILSIRSEEVLLFLVFLIHIKNPSQDGNKFIILIRFFCFSLKKLLLCNLCYIELFTKKFKCSLLHFFFFLSWWNYSQLRFNWTEYYYNYYIYIYMYVCMYNSKTVKTAH